MKIMDVEVCPVSLWGGNMPLVLKYGPEDIPARRELVDAPMSLLLVRGWQSGIPITLWLCETQPWLY